MRRVEVRRSRSRRRDERERRRPFDEADFAIHQEGGQTCIQVFFFRTGQNWGNRAYFPKADPALEPRRGAERLPGQFYDDKPMPRPILLSRDGRGAGAAGRGAVAPRPAARCRSRVPQRGEKQDLIDHALQNAREALGRRLAETSTQARLLAGFAETFGLAGRRAASRSTTTRTSWAPMRSARMVVAGPEGFVKNQYRKFNIRSTEITPGDDFGMMREVMQRRFSRLVKEHGEAGPTAGRQPAADDEDDDACRASRPGPTSS